MGMIKDFEELDCWKEARTLVKMVYQATDLKPFSKDFGLKDQIQRAAVSVMANVAEGFDTVSNGEFVRFLGYSSRSCAEVRSHLYAALDVGYVDKPVFEEITEQTKKCSAHIKGFIRYLNRT